MIRVRPDDLDVGVRKHFWMEVARGHGAGSSPTKYGLNGTMPAMVKRTEGS